MPVPQEGALVRPLRQNGSNLEMTTWKNSCCTIVKEVRWVAKFPTFNHLFKYRGEMCCKNRTSARTIPQGTGGQVVMSSNYPVLILMIALRWASVVRRRLTPNKSQSWTTTGHMCQMLPQRSHCPGQARTWYWVRAPGHHQSWNVDTNTWMMIFPLHASWVHPHVFFICCKPVPKRWA